MIKYRTDAFFRTNEKIYINIFFNFVLDLNYDY